MHGLPGERGLVRTGLSLGVARPRVPGAWYHRLVIGNLLILDHDPVAESAARRFHEARAASRFRPRGWFPQLFVMGLEIAGADIGDQLVVPTLHRVADDLGLECTRGRAAERGVERRDRHLEFRKGAIYQLLRLIVTAGVEHEHARKWADLDHVAFP